MANAEHLKILKSGVKKWNKWRYENKDIKPDLSDAELSDADLSDDYMYRAYLSRADLSRANLRGANLESAYLNDATLSGAYLSGVDLRNAELLNADLSDADLSGANLNSANLSRANLIGASLIGSSLIRANLYNADLSGANLNSANLTLAYLSDTNLSDADLSGANLNSAILIKADFSGAKLEWTKIFGISAWGIKKENSIQRDLIITEDHEPVITIDNLEVAQFIYLMLNNQNIRDVIDTITSKSVLILGNFKKERKAVLDTLKDELRRRNYLPILFDFEKPASRDITETISILAKMSRFVIADLTDAKSIPQELSHIVPHTPSLPILPIILEGQREYAMFEHFKPYPWVLPLYSYQTPEAMLSEIVKVIIEPAERKVKELRGELK